MRHNHDIRDETAEDYEDPAGARHDDTDPADRTGFDGGTARDDDTTDDRDQDGRLDHEGTHPGTDHARTGPDGEALDADARHDGDVGRASVDDDLVTHGDPADVDGERSTGTYVGDGNPDTPVERMDRDADHDGHADGGDLAAGTHTGVGTLAPGSHLPGEESPADADADGGTARVADATDRDPTDLDPRDTDLRDGEPRRDDSGPYDGEGGRRPGDALSDTDGGLDDGGRHHGDTADTTGATSPDAGYARADQHDAGDPDLVAADPRSDAQPGTAGMGTVDHEPGTAGMGTVDGATAGMGTVDHEPGTAGMGTVDGETVAAGTAGMGQVDDHPGTAGTGAAEAQTDRELRPGEADTEAPMTALWGEDVTRDLRERWREVQLKFVDDPRAAAGEAEGLVSEVIQSFHDALGRYKESLDDWRGGEGGDTENLRTALRRYRDFFDRVLGM